MGSLCGNSGGDHPQVARCGEDCIWYNQVPIAESTALFVDIHEMTVVNGKTRIPRMGNVSVHLV